MPAAVGTLTIGLVLAVAGLGAGLALWASPEHDREPITVAVEGDLSRTLSARNLSGLRAMERRIARLDGVEEVVGPGTFIERAIVRAERRVEGARADERAALFVRLGSIGAPSLASRSFVETVVYGAGTAPKPRLRWLFPDNHHAVIVVRPAPGLEPDSLLGLVQEIQQVTAQSGVRGVS